MKQTWIMILCLFVLTACEKSPSSRTRSVGSGGTGAISAGGTFVVFSGELMTGGGAFLYPGDAGQSLSFADRSNPTSERSIRYSWTGETVASQHVFVGFTLMHTPLQADYGTAPARNLAAAGYTRVTFDARGDLSSNTLVKIEVADDGNGGTANASCVSLSESGTLDALFGACGNTNTLEPGWRRYSVPIAAPGTALANLKDFIKVTFIFNDPFPGNTVPGQGGVIYIDQIQYE